MVPDRVCILGMGLLGGSLARAVRAAAPATWVVGWDRNAEVSRSATDERFIDEAGLTAEASVAHAALVVLCTPIDSFDDLFTAIGPRLSPGAIVTDVGSTKRSVVDSARRMLPDGVLFVGGHPMTGGERNGLAASRPDLFQGGLCLLTPTDSTDPHALHQVEQFWDSLGMSTRRLTPDHHDALVARASHLPHAVAAALVNAQSEASLSIAAKGFGAVTRPAAGDPALWQGIFTDNRDHLSAALHDLRGQLDLLQLAVDANDAAAVHGWLQNAADLRNSRPW